MHLLNAATRLLFLILASASLLAALVEIKAIEVTASDLQRSSEFYTGVLEFKAEPASGAKIHLRLGEESLLLAPATANGQHAPLEFPANDRLFEHIAIVVSDMDVAYLRLLQHNVKIVSTGPQRLPDWNHDAAGIRALYFRDPDDHFLELIEYPSDKGEPRWHRKGHALFLGIDHTAIAVTDTKRSLRFYRNEVGMTISGDSLNYGKEQDLLNGVPGSRVKITSLKGARGPGVELLEYEQPGLQGLADPNPAPGEIGYWQMNLQSGSVANSLLTRDPDGHALFVEQRAADTGNGDYALEALRRHWTRYLEEGAELGIFMAVALLLTVALEYPPSPIRKAIGAFVLRRFILGLGIAVTVVCLIYSPWGMQSGALFNPSVTMAFLYLKQIQPWDAFFYVLAQFMGGWLGLVIAAALCGRAARHKKVNFVVTEPGPQGAAVAFAAEFVISFLLMAVLLTVNQHNSLKPKIGYFAGLLLLLYITFEAPYSGMSLNPARSVASAIPARSWKAMWLYFAAPTLAMLVAAILCGR